MPRKPLHACRIWSKFERTTAMLTRVLEPEVMDSPEEARDYDAMDHGAVNRAFVVDFLAAWNGENPILDVGTGTALIPIELCRQAPAARVVAVDLAEHMIRLAEIGRAHLNSSHRCISYAVFCLKQK